MSIEGDTLYRHAGALCIVAGSHHTDDWPCSTHLTEARLQLSAPASTSSTGVAARLRPKGDVDGAAGRAPGPPLGQAGGSTLQTDNRPGLDTRPAEGATAIARNEGTS